MVISEPYCFSFILGTVHMQQYKWRVVAKTKLITKSCTATATIFRHGRHESGYVIIYKYGHACWRWALKMKMCTWCFSNGVFDTLISTAARTDEQKIFYIYIYKHIYIWYIIYKLCLWRWHRHTEYQPEYNPTDHKMVYRSCHLSSTMCNGKYIAKHTQVFFME